MCSRRRPWPALPMRPGFSNPVVVRAGRRPVVAALTARRLDRSACPTAGWEPARAPAARSYPCLPTTAVALAVTFVQPGVVGVQPAPRAPLAPRRSCSPAERRPLTDGRVAERCGDVALAAEARFTC